MLDFLPISAATILVIRPLKASDTADYRTLRQRILKSSDARYFSDSFERERQLNDTQWREWCTEKPGHCILGTFANDELVGILMITRQGAANSPVVEWEAAWLEPHYRSAGTGKLAYELARQWSRDQGYKYVVGFIRATFTPALHICKKQGFAYIYTVRDELWADGSVGDVHAFLLDLRPLASEYASIPVLERFKEAMPFLSQGLHAPQLEHGETIAA